VIGHPFCINIGYDATPFFGVAYTFFWGPFVPYPKKHISYNTYKNNKNSK